MVKCHKTSGKERHYRKHQKSHMGTWYFGPKMVCDYCKFNGHGGGFVRGTRMCCNPKSRHYRKAIYIFGDTCNVFEWNTDKVN